MKGMLLTDWQGLTLIHCHGQLGGDDEKDFINDIHFADYVIQAWPNVCELL